MSPDLLTHTYHSVRGYLGFISFFLFIASLEAQPAAIFEGKGNFDVGVRATSVTGRGVHASSVSDDAVYGFSLVSGVTGETSATNGEVFGVRGLTISPDGRGVYGENLATTGSAFGVYGLSNSSSGSGVFGRASATTGTNYGVRGISFSSTGRGV